MGQIYLSDIRTCSHRLTNSDQIRHANMLSTDQPRPRPNAGSAPAVPVFLGTSIYAHSI